MVSSLKRAVDPDTAYEEIFTLMNFVPRTTTTKLGSMILDLGTFIIKEQPFIITVYVCG